MSTLRLLSLLSVVALAMACEPPPEEPSPPADPGDGGEPGAGGGGSSGDGSGDGAAGGGTGGDGAGASATARLTLSLAPGEPPADATRLDVDVVGVSLFDARPSWADADTPCDAGVTGALVPRTSRVEVSFGGDAVPFLQLDLPTGTELRELWIIARHGALLTPGRTYEVHAGRLCTMPDGLQYILLRARPATITLDAARTIVLELGRDQLPFAQVDCRTSSAEECATSDDGTDDDLDTRLRYEFTTELPARSAP